MNAIPPRVSAIVVNWNTCDCLDRCLQTLSELWLSGAGQVIVVDNASTDGSPEMVRRKYPEVILLALTSNVGFGPGCNAGLARADAPYALLLNSDIESEPGAVMRLVEFLDSHPDAGACGGRLVLPNGATQTSAGLQLNLWWVFCEQFYLAKLFPATRLFGGYTLTWWDYASDRPVDQVVGACLLLRRAADERFPRFDERYFMYAEDTDLCERIRRTGQQIWYVHDAVFHHRLGASSEQKPVRAAMIAQYNISRGIYFHDRQGAPGFARLKALVTGGALLRLGIWQSLGALGRAGAAEQVQLFREVLNLTRQMRKPDTIFQ